MSINVPQFSEVATGTIGFPRVGKDRELKKALETYWAGTTDRTHLLDVAAQVEKANLLAQVNAGIERIGVGSFSLYDQVLDWTFRLGLIPSRFANSGKEGLDLYFALARGIPGARALHMTKWFDTNYHYLVPEIEEPFLAGKFAAEVDFSDFLQQIAKSRDIVAAAAAGKTVQSLPIVLGPVTLVKLCRYIVGGAQQAAPETKAQLAAAFLKDHVLPHYVELFKQLKAAHVDEVLFQEPILVVNHDAETRALLTHVLEALADGPKVHLVTFFDDLGEETFKWLQAAPKNVVGVSLDFTRGDNAGLLAKHGLPKHLTLGAGVVDARNVWQINVDDVISKLAAIRASFEGKLVVQPSASLQHVPYDATVETKLPSALRQVLAFAFQKLKEVDFIARLIKKDGDNAAALEEKKAIEEAWSAFHSAKPSSEAIRTRIANLKEEDLKRAQAFAQRKPQQVPLPLFYTTSIGSLPQTTTVRGLRVKLQRGRITADEYRSQIDQHIAHSIGLQEGLGIDVPVHGEFERTDMVEYFGQKIDGFAFTNNGWVQSYGSRCVRPPIIWGDLSRSGGLAMTVREFVVAQSYTHLPVKAMLTGPTTILNWSFPRADITRREQALQIALVLRDEIDDLTKAGAKVVQVDEPALREGLPLNAARRDAYLQWAVDSFRLATAGAPSSVQIVTHMCYAEFDDVMAAIDALDADVISIENSRNNDKTIKDLTAYGYERDIGPGVYDIHSPVVPTVDEIVEKLRLFLKHLHPSRVVVNPDCGLKTRQWKEVVPSLRNMVTAASILRAEYESNQQHRKNGLANKNVDSLNKDSEETKGGDA